MKAKNLAHDLWPYARTVLPENLNESARETGALVRKRDVRDAETLMRMLLAYGLTDLSFQSVAAWASSMGLASMSGPAFFYRVRDAEQWLSRVLAEVLSDEVGSARVAGLRLLAVDATVVNGPGAKGTEWRLHVLAEPETGRISSVVISDEHAREDYERHPIKPGDVVLGDRAYARSGGIGLVKSAGGDVVVRFNPRSMRLCDEGKRLVDLLGQKDRIPQTGAYSWRLTMPVLPKKKRTGSHKSVRLSKASDWIPIRAIAARRRAGTIVWVLTTLSEDIATDADVMDLYRLRWQIELLFKRLKSLLDLDCMPSRRGPTARSWLLARLLAAAIAQKLVPPSRAFPPWGYRLR